MKKLIFIVLLCVSQTALAEYSWRGAELMFSVESSVELGDNLAAGQTLSLFGNSIAFVSPENGIHMYFAYIGPMWVITDWFWVSPLIGTGINWADTTAFDASLWIGFSFFEGQFTMFFEGDFLANHFKDVYDYYGFYALDYHPIKWLKLGVHGEQIEKGVMFGPHFGLNKPDTPWSFDVQYYFGVQKENKGHTFRVKTSCAF